MRTQKTQKIVAVSILLTALAFLPVLVDISGFAFAL
jgi:hypothetical protein